MSCANEAKTARKLPKYIKENLPYFLQNMTGLDKLNHNYSTYIVEEQPMLGQVCVSDSLIWAFAKNQACICALSLYASLTFFILSIDRISKALPILYLKGHV